MQKGVSKIDYEIKRAELFSCLEDIDFVRLTNVEKAKVIGVSDDTIRKYLKEITPEKWEEIVEATGKKFAKDELEIRASIIAEAKGGSVEHQKLALQYIKGWSPKQTNENINRDVFSDMTPDEKLAKAKEIASKLAGKVDLGVVEPQKPEEKSGNG